MNTENTNSTKRTLTPASKRRLRNDIILVFAVLAVALAVFLIFHFGGSAGERVAVSVNGEIKAVYPLSEDIRVDIDFGGDSDYTNQLVIEQGVAYVSSANCPDGICREHRPISRRGETIVCLPHRLVIEIE